MFFPLYEYLLYRGQIPVSVLPVQYFIFLAAIYCIGLLSAIKILNDSYRETCSERVPGSIICTKRLLK